MTILTKAFFSFMSCDFVTFSLLSAWHKYALFLYLEIYNCCLELAGELEGWNCTFWYRNFFVSFRIATNTWFTSFETECAKTANLNMVSFG